MKITVIRLGDDGETTLGAFYINGILRAFTVEDQEQKGDKISGETRVPEGRYSVNLRSVGGFHERYDTKYGEMHKGMLCISNRPDWVLENNGKKFQYILIHTGNTDDHTAGCLLVNDSVNADTYRGSGSVSAYKDVYPEIAQACEEGEEVLITYIDMEDGK